MRKGMNALASMVAVLGSLPGCGGGNLDLTIHPEDLTCETLADPKVSWLIQGFQGSDLVDLPQGCPPACANARAVAELRVGERRQLKLNPGTGPDLDCTGSFASTIWTSTNRVVAAVDPDAAISQGALFTAIGPGETSLYADITFRGKSGSVRALPSAFPSGSGFPVTIATIRVR